MTTSASATPGVRPVRPLAVVLAAIRRPADGALLLLQRRADPYRGWWGLPGGKVCAGESIARAACREAREETGFDLAFDRLAGIASETIHAPSGPSAASTDGPDGASRTATAHFMLYVVALKAAPGTDLRTTPPAHREGTFAWVAPDGGDDARRIIPTDRDLIARFVLARADLTAEPPHYDIAEATANGG